MPYSGRSLIGSSSGCQAQTGHHQNMEMEEGSVKQPELQPGHCGDIFLHRRLSFPSAKIPLKKAEDEVCDGRDPVDPTSQWSDMSQFYGGSDTFWRFGLKMVEQYLREEELRGRHQSALFRLREKALREKARAELAWLEHEERRGRVRASLRFAVMSPSFSEPSLQVKQI
nr:PREDICTED: coiled-coil domain-containing protein 187 [Anolis carolinensis]|eukprot:XP_016854441.1 PREDICTED: coiled-coil domain-containing protein 187 [Anolis carolinensis]